MLLDIPPETKATVALKVFKKASFETGEEGGYLPSIIMAQDLFRSGRHMQCEPVYRFSTLLLQSFFPGGRNGPKKLGGGRNRGKSREEGENVR